ncbi:MAG: HAD hydrolase-like protein, partial [Parabacteroides sp.]
MKSYEYILMDLDGTLTDPFTGITKSVQYALNHYGIVVDNLTHLAPFIGPPLVDSF